MRDGKGSADMRMGRRIPTTLRRTAIHAGPTVLGIIVLDFLLLQLMPGDAADVIASESGVATAETMAALRERFGLDQPVLTQLMNFLGHLVQFDLGFSPRYNMSGPRHDHDAAARHPAADGDGAVAGAGPGHRHRLGHGGVGRPLARPPALGRRAAVLFHAGLLGRADGDRAVLGEARLAAERRQHDDRRQSHGLRLPVRPAGASRPAGAGARLVLRRRLCAAGARLDAGGAAPGLHAHRAGQGPASRSSSSSATRCATR